MEEMEILETAIEAEKVSLITYLGAAEKTGDESGKNMFIRLAIDEFSHMRMLEEQRSNLLEKGCWTKFTIEKSTLEELVPRLKQNDVKVKGQSGMNEIDALNSALEFEEKAANYYREHSNTVADESAKQMFRRLAEMEEAHYELVQAELDYIQGTGYWFGVREFTQE